MKLKDYKKQLNESIEVIDVHDKVSEYAKNKVYETSTIKNAKPNRKLNKILVFSTSFAIVILAFVLTIPLIINNNNKAKYNDLNSEHMGEAYSDYSNKEAGLAPSAENQMDASNNQTKVYEDPVEVATPGAISIEPTMVATGTGTTNELYTKYSNYTKNTNGLLSFNQFEKAYYSFQSGSSIDNFITSYSLTDSAELREDLEYIYNLVN